MTLGPTNPQMIDIAEETLGFRCAGFSPAMRLLMPAFALPYAPADLTIYLHSKRNASLPLPLKAEVPNFGIKL